MSATHVRRGSAPRAKPRKPAGVSVPKKIAKRLPVDQARANKVAGLVFGAFVLAIAVTPFWRSRTYICDGLGWVSLNDTYLPSPLIDSALANPVN